MLHFRLILVTIYNCYEKDTDNRRRRGFRIEQGARNGPEKSFKEIVNEVLRRGLKSNSASNGQRKRFKVEPLNLGLREDLDFNNIEDWLDRIEGPFRK